MLLRRRDDRPPAAGRARLGEGHLGDPAIELAGVLAGPDDVEREVLEHPDADAGRPRASSSWRNRTARSSIGSAARANRSRWKARSTTVATHQPVIGSLRSSNRPAAIAQPASSGAPIASAKARAKISPTRSTDAVVGACVVSPRSAAIDVGRHAGHPARVDQVEIGEVDASR